MADDDKTKALRLIVEDGQVLGPLPPPGDGGAEPPKPKRKGDLPDGCPVEALGTQDGVFFYLDDLKQLRALPAREHSRLGVMSLFGRQIDLLEQFWPRKTWNKVKELWETTGWKPERAAEQLMAAASGKGVWDPFERVRGRGGWRGSAGELILHCGDHIFDGAAWHAPGKIGPHVYPAGSAIPQPAPDRQRGGDEGPGEELLALFNSWNWRRGELDALLLLGWCCAGFIGGALDWRPTAWVTGDRSTGKSTLQKAIARLYQGALVSVADASAAGIWQKLGHATLPVAFDELESESDNRRGQGVIKLARLAASGALVLRGGADHNANEFVARSCFLFSSILVPPLLGQDRSRMAILELLKLENGAPPDVGEQRMARLGTAILRRLLDGWARYPGTLERYRAALMNEGHGARGADVFGTMLALADVARFDNETSEKVAAAVAKLLAPSSLAELHDDASDQERCLQHLLTTAIPKDGGGLARRPVALHVERAASDPDSFDDTSPAEAQRILGTYGLRIEKRDGQKYLGVANNHVELAKLFEGTQWASQPGAMGVWVQALRRLPMAEASTRAMYFAGATCKGTLVPLELCFGIKPDERQPATQDGGALPLTP